MSKRTHDDPRLNAIIRAAIGEARARWIAAAAAEVDGDDDTARMWWDRWRLTTARAWMYARLEGVARSYGLARALGVSFPPDPEPEPVAPEKLVRGGRPVRFLRGDELAIAFGDDGQFVSGPFLEAVEGFRGRIPRLAPVAKGMARQASQVTAMMLQAEAGHVLENLAEQSRLAHALVRGSFFVSDVNMSTAANIRSILAEAIRGVTVDDRVSLPGFIDRAQIEGAANLTKARLETVYRTNLATAYTEGQAEGLRDPVVQQVMPLLMIDAISDSRTRDEHAAMDGYVNTAAYFDRMGLWTPNGYNCRCSIIGVTIDQAESLGLLTGGIPDAEKIRTYNGDRQDLIDRGEYPDRGFGGAAA